MAIVEHCYHDNGLTYSSRPPRYGQTCCWCGGSRIREEKHGVPPGHGQFIPDTRVEDVFVEESKPQCIERQA